jgi:hypothetical protein
LRRYIEIQLPKCKVFLTPEEINYMLQRNPEMFAEAIRRGKGILRARKARERREKDDTAS